MKSCTPRLGPKFQARLSKFTSVALVRKALVLADGRPEALRQFGEVAAASVIRHYSSGVVQKDSQGCPF